MRDRVNKIIRFEINAQNKQLINSELDSKDYQHVNWERTKIEITIDLADFAFSNVEYLNIELFCWLKLRAIDVSIIINNVADNELSYINNVNFFNSIVSKLEECNLIKYLKITVRQANIFNAADFGGLIRMPSLQVLDLSDINIQQNEMNDYLVPIITLLNNIDETSKIAKILFPNNFKQQALNVEYDYENQFFNAIKYALFTSIRLIEISPLPIFLELQDNIQAIIHKKQGGHLEELYYEHDRDYKTIKALRNIPPNERTSELEGLLVAKTYKHDNAFKDIEHLCQIIDIMRPKNIYWLDRILREKLGDPSHILSCLRAVKLYDDCRELLFKMLQGVVSDVMAGRFKEIDPNPKELTNFVCAEGTHTKDTILKTILKIHLEFDISEDQYLAKLLSNMIEEFVYGCGGLKSEDDITRLAPNNQLGDLVVLLMNVLRTLRTSHLDQQIEHILQEEIRQRNALYTQQLEQQNDLLLFAFNYFRTVISASNQNRYYSVNLHTPRFGSRNTLV